MSKHGGVHDWLQGVKIGSHPFSEDGSCPARENNRKRSSQDLSSHGGHTSPKRRLYGRLDESKVLADATGNIMSPRNAQSAGPRDRENPPFTPRRSQRAGPKPAGIAETRGQEQETEEMTPRAVRSGMDSAPDLLPPHSLPHPAYSASSPSRSSTDASSARSKSPVKSMADLRMAQRPTELHRLDAATADEAGGVLVHYPRLVRISRGEAVIPFHLRNSIEEELPEADRPPSWAYAPADDAVNDEVHRHQQSWGKIARTLNKQAIDCEQRGLTEANWNLKVHNPLIDLVVGNPRYKAMVEQMNITHARIQPNSLSPVHLSGDLMQNKMVDLAILLCLHPDARKQLRSVFERLPKNSQSINQTMQNPLREQPIALNIETKTPFSGGDTADLQLAVWSGAGLLRLRRLLEVQNRANENIFTLPMLSLHGHDLHLSAIQERADHNRVYGKLRIGSTDNILGIFQMVAGIELLVDWANTDLRKWYEEKIYTPAGG